MKRNCYFNFAGKNSKQFHNLILAFIDDSSNTYDSGGSFELVTDELPGRADTVLYGKKYSSSHMEFSIEIINPDRYLTSEEMIEIKDWLFGQDGWAKLELLDDDAVHMDCYLNCILQPDQDIFDGGYRGIRCTLINQSSFAYKNPVVIYDRDYKDLLKNSQNAEVGDIKSTINKGQDDPLIKNDGKYIYHTINVEETTKITRRMRCGICKYLNVYVKSAEKVVYPTVEIVTTNSHPDGQSGLYFGVYRYPAIYNGSMKHGMVLMNFDNQSFARKYLTLVSTVARDNKDEVFDYSEYGRRIASIYKRKYVIDCATGIYKIYKLDSDGNWVDDESPLSLRVYPSLWHTFGFLKLKNGLNRIGVTGWVESMKISYTPKIRLGAF